MRLTRLPPALVLGAAVAWLRPDAGVALLQDPPRPALESAVTARLAALPVGAFDSQIRTDYDSGRNQTRFWIDTTEDDGRLYSIAGGQMDVEFRIWSLAAGRPGESSPAVIAVDFASLGGLKPGVDADVFGIVADGRPVLLTQAVQPEARSGDLLFLARSSRIPLDEFLRVATSTRVEGTIWGHRFGLVATQLSMLRAYARRVIGI